MTDTLSRFLAFRERHSGSVQDVCSALVMLAFMGGAGFWLVVLT